MATYNIEVGKIYKWLPNGPTFICIAEDLETFTGVCIDSGDSPANAVGSRTSELNADADQWQMIRMDLVPIFGEECT